MLGFATEPLYKQVAEHDTSPQQANFCITLAQSENFSGLRSAQSVDITERNDLAIVFWQSGNGFSQQLPGFFAEKSFAGNLSPIREKNGSVVGLFVIGGKGIKRNLPPFPQAHARFIDGNAQEPRRKLRKLRKAFRNASWATSSASAATCKMS